jgi:hypothetical protein
MLIVMLGYNDRTTPIVDKLIALTTQNRSSFTNDIFE